MAAANRAAALAANSHEAAFARDKALFIGGSFEDAENAPGKNESPDAPGKKPNLTPAAQRARRREGAARFGRKALAAFMAVVLAIGLMPLPAFGDDGSVRGVSFNGNLIAGSISTTTTVDADGNETTETTRTKVDDEGNVVSETETDESSGDDSSKLDSDANLRGQYLLNQATSLKSDGTIQDLAGTDIGKVSDGSDARLSVAAGVQAQKDKADEEQQAKVDEAQAAFDAEDSQIDVSGVQGDFSSQRIVVALKDGASLQERDLNNVTGKADGMYVLAYKNVDAAKRAYVRYTRYEGAAFAAPDVAVEASADGDDNGDGDDPDPVDLPKTESGDVDYTKVAKDGAQADDATQASTNAPEVDTTTYESDKKDLEGSRRSLEERERDAPDGRKTAVVAVIDTMVAQDAPVAKRLSVLADSQETVADGDPDRDSKIKAQHDKHGQKMVDAIVAQLESAGAQVVDADGVRLAGSEDDDARKVQIVSVEALDSANYGSAASVLAAAQLALASAPGVVNMSFAGYNVEGNAAISEAVKLLAEGPDGKAGTADDADVVAAAGNANQDAKWFVPASSDGATAVGALDEGKVSALREQAARELFGDGDLSLDDEQAAELDSAVAGRVAADPQAYKTGSSNRGEAVAAWAIADSTSLAAARASGYAAANGSLDGLAQSPLAAGSSREFAAAGAQEGPGDAQGGEAVGSTAGDGGPEGAENGPAEEPGIVAGIAARVGDAAGAPAPPEGVSAASDLSGNATRTVNGRTEKAWLFDYQGKMESVDLGPGTYRLEVWGAQGGWGLHQNRNYSPARPGGKGGYSYVDIAIDSTTTVYVHVGGKGANGKNRVNAAGGYNGGGSGTMDGGDDESAGGGGGATHMAVNNSGTLEAIGASNGPSTVLLVAGGGSGGVYETIGSYGGGESGQRGNSYGTNHYGGAGGTQTTGYKFGRGQDGQGVGAWPSGGDIGSAGGGGGWYGGYSALGSSTVTPSAGGGSGYVTKANLIAGVEFRAGRTDNGGDASGTASGAADNGSAAITLTTAPYKVAYDPGTGGSGTAYTAEGFTTNRADKALEGPGAAEAKGFSRAGYHITGWNTRADGTGTAFALGSSPNIYRYNGALINADDTVTLYAQWEPNTYSIVFRNSDKDTGEATSESYTVEVKDSTWGNVPDYHAADPTAGVSGQELTKPEGYHFKSWHFTVKGTAAGGESTWSTDYVVDKDHLSSTLLNNLVIGGNTNDADAAKRMKPTANTVSGYAVAWRTHGAQAEAVVEWEPDDYTVVACGARRARDLGQGMGEAGCSRVQVEG